jgi:hypothetical protein
MTKKTDWAVRHLSFFAQTKAPERIHDAIETLEDIEPSEITTPPDVRLTRRDVLKAWFQVLATIDGSLDPKFNPDDVPEMSVSPPASGGVSFPPGVDPQAIRDPQARADYEVALAKNRKKADDYNLQTQLRLLNPKATGDTERFVKSHFHPTPEDRKEVGEVADEVSLGKDRRAWFLGVL